MKLSVVIPLFNEGKNVGECVERLDGYLKNNFDSYEIVAVNDGSTDDTKTKLDLLKNGYPNLKVVSYDKNRGKGCAVRTGILSSDGDTVLYTDRDLAYGEDTIGKIVKFREEKLCDIAIGSRNIDKSSYEGYTFLRKILSKTYLLILKTLSGFSHSDSQCGIKAFDGKIAKNIFGKCETDGFSFDLEALLIAENEGYSICEMPVKIINNANSESKVNPVKDSVKMFKDVIKIRKKIKNIKK